MNARAGSFTKSCWGISAAWIVFATVPWADVCHADDDGIELFEKSIRPILIAHCYECHSADAAAAKKLKGGLRLDSRATLRRGGDGGPVVVPGDPDASRLIRALRYDELEMPPKGKLPDSVVAAFVKWVEIGAPDPRDATSPSPPDRRAIDLDEGRRHWAFRAPVRHAPPSVTNTAWPLSDIDRFVLAKLEEKGFPPAGDAEPHLLLRRVYLDLTGLPPSPREVEAFVGRIGSTSEALEAVVDRVLASPEFGKRWARHWLDLTGYADTLGVGRAIPAPPAWRYRDYVIAALNSDKPYDQFILEQLAGDRLALDMSLRGFVQYAEPEVRAEQITATGFLAIGPWELVNADKIQLRMDVVDGQIDRVGRALLGLTLGCARCHDHKFDPIRQKDYYALAGIFASTLTLRGRLYLPFSDVNRTSLPETPEQLLYRAAKTADFQKRLATTQRELKAAREHRDSLSERVDVTKAQLASVDKAEQQQLSEKLAQLEEALKESEVDVTRLDEHVELLKYIHPRSPHAIAVMDMPNPEEVRVNIRGSARDLGDVVPRGFIAVASRDEKATFDLGSSGRLELARWMVDKRNPLTARVLVNRVWHHLFGAGLVRTVDNLGDRGERPSHPRLLDYLAVRFMETGWSIKKLIREIVLSRTYRLSSAWNKTARDGPPSEIDPDNRLLWRANRRRLEAEAIRDALLAVSGQLNRAAGGPTLPIDIPGNISVDGMPPSINPDATMPDDLPFRRTIYLPMRRGQPFDVLDVLAVFDFPDPDEVTGARTVSTVPTQALYLMNAPFIQERARATAARLAKRTPEDGERIELLYLLAYGRPPTHEEIERDRGFLLEFRGEFKALGKTADDAQESAWSRYCQAVLVSNEFWFRN